jgi:hypothetical protein
MTTFRLTAEVKDDRRITLTLPPDVPTGQVELLVTVAQPAPATQSERRSSAHGVEQQSKRKGKRNGRYPLRGSVISYERPTDPVVEPVQDIDRATPSATNEASSPNAERP